MDLKDLYQDIIIDHNRSPRNFRAIEPASCQKEGFNPLCGDHLIVYLDVQNGIIKDVSFQGNGCAISTASASLMTEALKGKTETEAETLFNQMHLMLTGDAGAKTDDFDQLGKLAALSGVKAYPARVKCASLCWHTVHAALQHSDQPVTTE